MTLAPVLDHQAQTATISWESRFIMDILSKIQQLRSLGRFLDILKITTKYGLADLFKGLPIPELKQSALKSNHVNIAGLSQNERIRMALTDLGTTFIKLGQFLSTREDIVGPALAHELEKLQADTPPDSPEKVKLVLQKELGQPIESAFPVFDDVPFASASIGQVHLAKLASGQEVLIKLQHDGIETVVKQDLQLITLFAELLEYQFPQFKSYQPTATARQFERTLLKELDFSQEKRNLEEFTRNFADDQTVHFPAVYPEFCRTRVLVMERLRGIPGTNLEELQKSGADMVKFADHAANVFCQMIFRDGFYHADPHPGNYMLLEGSIVGLIDFGMVGRIDNELREQLEDFVLACAQQDSASLAELILQVGNSPMDVDRASFQTEVADVLAEYWSMSAQEFELGEAFSRLNELLRRYMITLPSPIALLIKTLVMLEGSAKRLDPNFRIGNKLTDYRSQIIKSRLAPKRWIQKFRKGYKDWDRLLTQLPRSLTMILETVRTGHLNVRHEHQGLEKAIDRGVQGILAAALFLGSTQLIAQKIPPALGEFSVPGLIGLILSFVLGFRVLQTMGKSH